MEKGARSLGFRGIRFFRALEFERKRLLGTTVAYPQVPCAGCALAGRGPKFPETSNPE